MTNPETDNKKIVSIVDKSVEFRGDLSIHTIECDNGKKYQEYEHRRLLEAAAAAARKSFILNAEIGDNIEESILEEK